LSNNQLKGFRNRTPSFYMDWFKSGLAEAQRRAQEASEQAQKLAAQYSAQAKEQGTWLAEQAAVQAKQLKEKAAQEAQTVQARLAEYQAAQKVSTGWWFPGRAKPLLAPSPGIFGDGAVCAFATHRSGLQNGCCHT